jgi:competence ComEA-like helix-hairpin-helix protein
MMPRKVARFELRFLGDTLTMHHRSPAGDGPRRATPWLRRSDQTTVAAMVGTALVSAAAYWQFGAGSQGGWIEIDRAPTQVFRFEVDLNRADWPELALLPGVGTTLAKRIVAHRNDHGPFGGESELLEVSGIGPAILAKIRPYLAPLAGSQSSVGQVDRSRGVLRGMESPR